MVEEDILKLHVAKQDILRVQIPNSLEDTADNELGLFFRKTRPFLQELKQVAIGAKFQSKNNKILTLECVA